MYVTPLYNAWYQIGDEYARSRVTLQDHGHHAHELPVIRHDEEIQRRFYLEPRPRNG